MIPLIQTGLNHGSKENNVKVGVNFGSKRCSREIVQYTRKSNRCGFAINKEAKEENEITALMKLLIMK